MSDIDPEVESDDVAMTSSPQTPPPAEVAGLEALGGAPADDDDGPDPAICFEVRGTLFETVDELPGLALSELAAAQQKMARTPKVPAGADPMSPKAQAANSASMAVLAALGAVLRGCCAPDRREELRDLLLDSDPTIGVREMTEIMRDATQKVTGRPTKSA